jgi:hypothetical protein
MSRLHSGQSTLDARVRPFRRTTLQLRLRTQESAAALSPTGAIFEYLSDCAAAFGTKKPMLITSSKAIMLIILSLVAALIARYPFAVAAARSSSSFRSNPQPAVSQSVQVHT